MAELVDPPKGAKVYPQRTNPLDGLSDYQCYKRFRFHKKGIEYILSLVERRLVSADETDRGKPIDPMVQLLIALKAYAANPLQLTETDLFTVSQPSISRCILRVSLALADLLSEFVHFPNSDEEKHNIMRGFYALRGDGKGFPGQLLPYLGDFFTRSVFLQASLVAWTDRMCQWMDHQFQRADRTIICAERVGLIVR